MEQDLKFIEEYIKNFEIARVNINKGICMNQEVLIRNGLKLVKIMEKYDLKISENLNNIINNLITGVGSYNPFEFGALRENTKICKKVIEMKNEKNKKFLVDTKIFEKAPDYIKYIVEEINKCYQNNTYISCAVMLRRLIETLIIEAFELKGNIKDIQDLNGDFFQLKKLIALFLQKKLWNYTKNTRNIIDKLKDLGNISAHNRKFITQKSDIDKIYDDIRICLDDFIQTIY